MRKKIYLMTAAAVMTGIMVTACAPKKDAGSETSASTEQTTGGAETTEADETSDTADTADTADTDDTAGTDDTTKEDGAAGNNTDENVSADETLNKVHDAVKAVYGENYIPSMPYDTVAMEELFGVKADWYDAVIAEGPMISVHVETFIGVKAKPDKVKEVSSALEAYRKTLIESSVQYPMNIVKVEASQVVTYGDYVFFVMLGFAEEGAEAEDEKAALESAKKNNQLAVDAIEAVFKN